MGSQRVGHNSGTEHSILNSFFSWTDHPARNAHEGRLWFSKIKLSKVPVGRGALIVLIWLGSHFLEIFPLE